MKWFRVTQRIILRDDGDNPKLVFDPASSTQMWPETVVDNHLDLKTKRMLIDSGILVEVGS